MSYTKKEKQEIRKKIANLPEKFLPNEWTGERLPPAEDTMNMTQFGELLEPLAKALIELNEKLYNSDKPCEYHSPECAVYCAVCPHNKKEIKK